MAVAQDVHNSGRQGRRAARDGPYATTPMATVTAAGVPGPTWGPQLAYRGGQPTCRTSLARLMAMPVSAAATTSRAAAATA